VKSEILLDTGDSASNAVAKCSVFINHRCAESVCLYSMDFVSAGKNKLLLYRVSQKPRTMQIFMKIHINNNFIDHSHNRLLVFHPYLIKSET